LTKAARGLRVAVTDAGGRPVAAARRAHVAGLARWLARVAPGRARGVVNVACVGDARMRSLNRRHLGRDYATDVLAFSYSAGAPPPARTDADARPSTSLGMTLSPSKGRRRLLRPQGPPARAGAFLGDIVIATGVARRQARRAGHSEQTEIRVLALHGLLHLLGYDHHADDGAMERVEVRLRRQGGLREGLIERAHRS
jgi:probable rRNA maturation factor